MGLLYLFTNKFYFLLYMKLKLKFLDFLQHGSLHKAAFESQQALAISLLPIIRMALGPTQPSIRNVSGFLRGGVGGKGQDRIATYSHPSSVKVKTVAPYPYSRICLHEEDREIFTFIFYTIKTFPS